MDTDKLHKLQKSIYNLLELEEKKRELLFKLLEALWVKDYTEKFPDAKSVILARYFMRNLETREVEKWPTYELVDSKDHKRIDRLQSKFKPQYAQLVIKSYDLTKFNAQGKFIASVQDQITRSLNSR